MITKDQIPEEAICHVCGEPMKVIDLTAKAAELGMSVPEENSYVIECCNHELTIEDDEEFRQLRDMLLEYHRGVDAAQ